MTQHRRGTWSTTGYAFHGRKYSLSCQCGWRSDFTPLHYVAEIAFKEHLEGPAPIPDGPPIPMDQFRLGPYYGSEDMYRDMGINPGDRVAVEINRGVVFVDTVQSIRHTGPQWTPPELPWWRRALRTITPRPFRRPLPPGTLTPASITMQVGSAGASQRMARTLESIAGAGTIIDGLISCKPDQDKR